jgi:hypothetical protein
VVVKLTHIVGKDGYLRGPGALISNGETWSRINEVMMPEAQVVNSDSGRGNSRGWRGDGRFSGNLCLSLICYQWSPSCVSFSWVDAV